MFNENARDVSVARAWVVEPKAFLGSCVRLGAMLLYRTMTLLFNEVEQNLEQKM